MHATQRFAFAATLALALAGCGSSDPASTSEVTLAVRGGGAATYAISGTVTGAVVEGATVALSGRTAAGVAVTASATTSSRGRYAFKGLQAGTYTVMPSFAGYVFSPAFRSVTVSGADVTGQDFVSALGHAVSGTISGAVAEGVAVTLASTTGAAPVVTLTDATGRYAFTGIADGTYTLTPERSGFVFSLPSLTVTVSGADVGEQDFVSAVPTYMVSGTVSGAIAEGVTVTLSSSVTGTHQVATTDAAGRFAFAGVVDGAYLVTPEAPGYVFSPASRTVAVSGADVGGQDFWAAALHVVSGTVAGEVIQGVTLSLSRSGSLLQSATTDAVGAFRFDPMVDGTYVVTPSRTGYVFSGTVTGATAVTLTLSSGSAVLTTTVTDAAGQYAFAEVTSGSYTVTPSKASYAFSPTSRTVTVTTANVSGVSFSATAYYTVSGTVAGAVLQGVTAPATVPETV